MVTYKCICYKNHVMINEGKTGLNLNSFLKNAPLSRMSFSVVPSDKIFVFVEILIVPIREM